MPTRKSSFTPLSVSLPPPSCFPPRLNQVGPVTHLANLTKGGRRRRTDCPRKEQRISPSHFPPPPPLPPPAKKKGGMNDIVSLLNTSFNLNLTRGKNYSLASKKLKSSYLKDFSCLDTKNSFFWGAVGSIVGCATAFKLNIVTKKNSAKGAAVL